MKIIIYKRKSYILLVIYFFILMEFFNFFFHEIFLIGSILSIRDRAGTQRKNISEIQSRMNNLFVSVIAFSILSFINRNYNETYIIIKID